MAHDDVIVVAFSASGFIVLALCHCLAGYGYLRLALAASRGDLATWQVALGWALAVLLKYFTPAITLATGALLYVVLISNDWPLAGALVTSVFWIMIQAFQAHIAYRFPLEPIARLFDRFFEILTGAPLDLSSATRNDPK